MNEYIEFINASKEVKDWVENTLNAYHKKHPKNVTECEHILDYLVSDSAPKRLKRMSYAQAKAGADKWTKTSQKKGKGVIDSPEDLETIHDFSDGSKIVKLMTKKAFEREGFFMKHCLGSYDPDGKMIYSYRTPDNQPHATFEVSHEDGDIFQIKGKGNGVIHPKYIEPILIFLKSIDKSPRPSEMKNLGYYVVDDAFKTLLDMFVCHKGHPPIYHNLYGVRYVCA